MSEFTEQLNRIEDKANQVFNAVMGGLEFDRITDRIAKLESSIFSGSGAGVIINSAAIAEVLQSTNFVTGVSGWRILKSGNMELQDAIVRGTIYASAGSFSGPITVGTGGSLSSGQTAYDTGIGFWLEYNGGTPRFSIGNSAGSKLTWDGTTLAVAGTLQSTNYVAGVSGWKLDLQGRAELQEVIVRGQIVASTLTYNELQGIAGSSIVVKSAGNLDADVTTPAVTGSIDIDITDPVSGHVQLFSVGDVLRIQFAGSEDWLEVTGVTDNTTYYTYTTTVKSGGSHAWKKGTAVLDYGPVSTGGGIITTAVGTGSPRLTVFTNTATPWTSIDERVRIGNLNGWGGFSSDVYGFALGNYSGGSYIQFDPVTNVTKLSNGGGDVVIDDTGITLVQGVYNVNRVKWDYGAYTVGDIGTAIYVGDGNVVRLYVTAGDVTYEPPYTETIIKATQKTNSTVTEILSGVNVFPSGGGGGGVYSLSIINVTASAYEFPLYIKNNEVGTASTQIYFTGGVKINTTFSVASTPAAGYLQLDIGTAINEFSTDGTLADNSDTAVPTEKAVKTYVNTLDSAKVSKLRESDDGADAWQTDAAGNLLGNGTRDIYPASKTQGLNTRFERLFGADKPSTAYGLLRTEFRIDDFANNSLGFHQSSASPYPLSAPFSANIPASCQVSSNEIAHSGTMYNGTGVWRTDFYLQWTLAAGKQNNYILMAMAPWTTGGADLLFAEYRIWADATPTANSRWWAIRWRWNTTSAPQYPLQVGLWYSAVVGDGLTFAAGTGTLAGIQGGVMPGQYNLWRGLIPPATTAIFLDGYLRDGAAGFSVSANIASMPTIGRCARLYLFQTWSKIYIDEWYLT